MTDNTLDATVITNPPVITIDLHGNRNYCDCTNPDVTIESTLTDGSTITETAHIPDGTRPLYPWDTDGATRIETTP